MKHFVKRKVLLLFIVVGLVLVENTYSQTVDENSGYKSPYYEYEVGQRLATSLLQGCSPLTGKIKKIEKTDLLFSVEKNFSGDKFVNETIKLIYEKPRAFSRYNSESFSPWMFVDIKEGNDLIVFLCESSGETKRNGLIISDKKLFPGIRKSVLHFILYKQNPKVISNVPQLVNSDNDEVFLGYVVSFLTRGITAENYNNVALVLSQLLENGKIPTIGFGWVRVTLGKWIAGEKYLTIATRAAVLNRLINLGSNNKKATEQAIVILIHLANDDRVNLNPYISRKVRQKLLQNYKSFEFKNVSQNYRKKFEKLLESS